MEYNTILNRYEHDFITGMHMDRDISVELELQTQTQNHNKLWHDVRKHRVTSSVFKDICSRKANFRSLAIRLLKSKASMTAAMKHGVDHEPVSAQLYAEVTGNSVYLCGFVGRSSTVRRPLRHRRVATRRLEYMVDYLLYILVLCVLIFKFIFGIVSLVLILTEPHPTD